MHFGNVLSVADTLFISFFSMLIVFLILLMISYVIDITAKFIKVKPVERGASDKARQSGSLSDNDEFVAVITASISAFNDGKDFKIRDIKENNSSWINSSRNNNVK